MLKIESLLVVFCLACPLTWAQSNGSVLKSWRLNELGKLQSSINAGATWDNIDCPIESPLNAFYVLNSEEAWAVGQNATVLRWDGEKWSELLVFSTENLLSVYFQDAQNGWAVGTNGTILFWNGLSWNPEESPTTETLIGIKRIANGSVQLTALSGLSYERINGQWKAPAPILSASMVHPPK
ncbi:WD40/YVTN/BNR-like repeat-containing protein [Runella slithyformis]|uniref:Photosynthesis system II assembly factor Ycf48/Hcf136-like domain-containing protein n=1 Tax=Runella slithyformis (strain ATCC 29530 / DSM 19594 / LMG 11500 / NCIMB 11436 / LSU 4) TaxID=761193 RepID=A0A7U3ZP73_RUNSL|nr:hypothetical protein [Runella slithyformis]AEI50815.1 hypothetical protein Runsl_4493 [Runella slithyformis DSM 19594]